MDNLEIIKKSIKEYNLELSKDELILNETEEEVILIYIEEDRVIEICRVNKEDFLDINKFRLGKILISRFYSREDVYSKVDLRAIEQKIDDLLYSCLKEVKTEGIVDKVVQAKNLHEKKNKIAKEEEFSKKIGRRLYVLKDVVDSIVIDNSQKDREC